MKSGIELIAEERERQISKEGWTAQHDDEHEMGELAKAAIAYTEGAYLNWPFDGPEPKFGLPMPFLSEIAPIVIPGRIRDLTKAGALIAAEIDRLQRLEPNE